MDDNKAADKSRRDQDTTTKQTNSPSTGTNEEKRTGATGSASGSTQGGRTTEDIARAGQRFE